MIKNKYTFELVLIVVFLLLSQPFLFNVYLGPEISYLICGTILVFLAFNNKTFKHISSKTILVLVGLFIYFLLHLVFNTEYLFYTLLSIFDILFFITLIQLLNHNVVLRKRLFNWLHGFSLFVSVMIILALVLYTYLPGLFAHTDDFAGYHGFFNPVFGMVNDDKLRPCWYFAEPSYSGFFLGFNFLLSINKDYSSKAKKFFVLLLLFGGIVCTSSTGAFVYLAASLLVVVAMKMRISKIFVQIILYCAIIVSLLIIPKMDSYGLLTLAVERSEASFVERQNKMTIAKEVLESMTFHDKIIGKGVSYVTVKYEEGLSDAYNKLYVEYGLMFMIVFLFVVRKFTIKNMPLHCFFYLSFISIVICMAPIILICYYLADTYNN